MDTVPEVHNETQEKHSPTHKLTFSDLKICCFFSLSHTVHDITMETVFNNDCACLDMLPKAWIIILFYSLFCVWSDARSFLNGKRLGRCSSHNLSKAGFQEGHLGLLRGPLSHFSVDIHWLCQLLLNIHPAHPEYSSRGNDEERGRESERSIND